MKKNKKIIEKLSLNKETIANLNRPMHLVDTNNDNDQKAAFTILIFCEVILTAFGLCDKPREPKTEEVHGGSNFNDCICSKVQGPDGCLTPVG